MDEIIEMDESEFMPFYEVFGNFSKEEQDHIHFFLHKFRGGFRNRSRGKSQSKELKALWWVLILLKNLEDVED